MMGRVSKPSDVRTRSNTLQSHLQMLQAFFTGCHIQSRSNNSGNQRASSRKDTDPATRTVPCIPRRPSFSTTNPSIGFLLRTIPYLSADYTIMNITTMKSLLPIIVALLVVLSWESSPRMVQAFSVAPRRGVVVGGVTGMRILSSPTTTLHMGLPETKPDTATIAKRSDLDKGPAKKMDEVIFNFNKILIDSVYDLIW